ncbi:MAG: hypothetical protein HFG26_11540 [Provencibacterium sp.]|jgi:unsaturated rhamnogalacturonyl hydrolase|nr:hypothetical protein [Provencibacterium sp.]
MEQLMQDRTAAALEKSKTFIEELTVHSAVNRPAPIVTSGNRFFSWDNEHRSKENGEPYLYSWSYYNGVIFEGLRYIYEKTGAPEYPPYIKEFIDSMITGGALNEHAGYVPYHGLDCYKTASLVMDYAGFNGGVPSGSPYCQVVSTLYHDLTEVNACHAEEALGGNYWHCWRENKPPRYKVWLDGLYMAQPFLVKYAAKAQDAAQLEAVYNRFRWVADNMSDPQTGLYFHAANSREDVCPFFWLRAIGWYAMAQVNVMEYLPAEYVEKMKPDLKRFLDAMLRFQDASGMWRNLVDRPLTETNRTETSGTAMLIYCILKAVRMGWLEDTVGSYRLAAQKAFCCMAEEKLHQNALKDIYLMAEATGLNNYERADWYKVDEGKGVGPYIMAYAEMIKA